MNAMVSYYRDTIHNPGLEYCDVTMYKCKAKKGQRRSLGKPTKESQELVNERNRKMAFERMIVANFTEGRDLWVLLTFDEGRKPGSRAEVKAEMDKFLRRVKRAWEKREASAWEVEHNKGNKLPLKHVYVIEGHDGGKRFHVHLNITGGLSERQIKELWGKAEIVNARTLQGSEKGFEAMTVYVSKQGGLDKGEHHWYASRNMVKPEAAEHNGQVGKESVEELAKEIEDINAHIGEGVVPTEERFAAIEERYPGYYLAEASAVHIEQFGEWVIHVKLFRKDTEAGKRETKRRRDEQRAIAARRAAFGVL